MLDAKTVDTGAVELHYIEGGAPGLPLVLLHGGSARWQSWEPLLPDLLPQLHIIAPDLRGHGRSGWCAPYTLQAYATDILQLLQQRVTEPAIVCGHSLGGMVALVVAAQAGSRVRGVIVGDSPLRAQTWLDTLQATRPRLQEWHRLALTHRAAAPIAAALKQSPVEVPGQATPVPAEAVFGADSPWFDWMASNLAQLDPASLAILIEDAARAAEGYSIEGLVAALQCPVWLLQADPAMGAVMQDDEVQLAQRLSPLVQHQRLVGVSHALHATHPAYVGAALLDAVRAIERATA